MALYTLLNMDRKVCDLEIDESGYIAKIRKINSIKILAQAPGGIIPENDPVLVEHVGKGGGNAFFHALPRDSASRLVTSCSFIACLNQCARWHRRLWQAGFAVLRWRFHPRC